jgi:predicted esterase
MIAPEILKRHELRQAGAPPEKAKCVALLIHGRGATAESILSLADAVALPDLCYLAPQAKGQSWYPQSFMAPTAANEPFLSHSLARVAAIITDLAEEGAPMEKLALIGFSQGACLAAETALRSPRPYGFIGILSGGAIGPPGTPRDYAGSLAAVRVFIGCAERDPHIPRERVEETAELFGKLGARVSKRIYPGGFHGVNDDMLANVRAGLAALTPRTPFTS